MRPVVIVVTKQHGDLFREMGAYESASQIFLTPGRDYECHAIAWFEAKLLLQVVDDLGDPAWHRMERFEVVDTSIADDWILNLFETEPRMVAGPRFVAESIESYNAMLLKERPQIDLFGQRLKNRSAND
jgi:hypothetical protein